MCLLYIFKFKVYSRFGFLIGNSHISLTKSYSGIGEITLKLTADEGVDLSEPIETQLNVTYVDDFNNVETTIDVTLEAEELHLSWATASWNRWNSQGFITNFGTGCWTTLTRTINNQLYYFRYYPYSIWYYEFLPDGTVTQRQSIQGCENIPSEVKSGTWSVRNNVLKVRINNELWLDIDNFTDENTNYEKLFLSNREVAYLDFLKR
ncbi:MAG: hypothetical protein HQ521_02395 [Bacteroidetes bacterium]|nr:hypothetical protein [Bacteroidota bacterium]